MLHQWRDMVILISPEADPAVVVPSIANDDLDDLGRVGGSIELIIHVLSWNNAYDNYRYIGDSYLTDPLIFVSFHH